MTRGVNAQGLAAESDCTQNPRTYSSPRKRREHPMRIAVTSAIAMSLLCVAATGPAAADPVGNWLTKDGEAIVTIAKCGNALCGSIVALKEPNDPATGRPKTDENNPDAAKRN